MFRFETGPRWINYFHCSAIGQKIYEGRFLFHWIMGDDTLLSPTIMGMIRPRREEEGGRGGVHDAGRGRAIAGRGLHHVPRRGLLLRQGRSQNQMVGGAKKCIMSLCYV